jgi:serine/threonine-protein kinase
LTTDSPRRVAAGSRIGGYEVVALVGAGGMGEVYRARDTKLNREVALKILPALVSVDATRLARFRREAHVLASLNHPNIAAIHGFEDSSDQQALVLEFIDGPTLADIVARGAMPFDEAAPIARQICDALEAAHEQGIVHRDLKPANIKVRPDGTVKVLDFGLAKVLEPAAADSATAVASPTITSPALTRLGLILGTASYMSPEQAKGRDADKRSDVWAFGCVLYEMLTGKRAFEGDEVSETLASILKSEPDWHALPPTVPPSIRALVEGCLKKDRRERIGDLSAARFVLNQPALAPAASAGRAPRSRVPLWKLAAIAIVGAAIGAAAAASYWMSRRSAAPQIARFTFEAPQGQLFSRPRQAVAISPDGTRIVYATNVQLYVRSIVDFDAKPLPGTERALNPVFSPDSQSVAFFSDGSLRTINLGGGTPVPLVKVGVGPSGLDWTASGIYYSQTGIGIMRVSVNGGKPEAVVPMDGSTGLAHGPQLLPDGKTLLFTFTDDTSVGSSGDRWNVARVVIQSLETGKRQTLLEPGANARYLPTGHIVYALGSTLFARPFDPATLTFTGNAVPVLEGVQRVISVDSGASQFALSDAGTLVYVPGTWTLGMQQVFTFDRAAAAKPLKLPPGSYDYPRVSPDGKHLAYQTSDGKQSFVAVYDLSGTRAAARLTFGGNDRFPIWAADSRHVVFQSDRAGIPAIFRQSVDGGAAEQLTTPDAGTSHVPEAWLPNGDVLLYNIASRQKTSLWMLSVRDRKASQFGSVSSTLLPTGAVFSPDGKWVAYQSGDVSSGEGDVFVEPFPPNGTKHQIARGGRPQWSHDGKELFFIPGPNQFSVVKVTTSPAFRFTDPVAVPRAFGVSGPLSPRAYDITSQGEIIGTAVPTQIAGAQSTREVRVVLNWFEDLKARVPSK